MLRALQFGDKSGAKQLFFSENSDGKLEMMGNLEREKVVKFLETHLLQEESVSEDWIPKNMDNFPKLKAPLSRVKKNANMLKTASTRAMNFFKEFNNLKLGHGKFMLWHFPMEKSMLVHSRTLVDKLPPSFNLEQIISWSELQGVSMSNGRLWALKVDYFCLFVLLFVLFFVVNTMYVYMSVCLFDFRLFVCLFVCLFVRFIYQ